MIGLGDGLIPAVAEEVLKSESVKKEIYLIELYNDHTDAVDVTLHQRTGNNGKLPFFKQTLTAGCNHHIVYNYPKRIERDDCIEAEASVGDVVTYCFMGRKV